MLQVVAVLNGAGAILGIEEDLLGATVLAWGETLPDLVAMLAVARAGMSQLASPAELPTLYIASDCQIGGRADAAWRQSHMVCRSPVPMIEHASCSLCAGQGTMAVAACFGGPVLNLLMGTGAPVLGASFKHGILPFKLTHGVVALFLETVRAGV